MTSAAERAAKALMGASRNRPSRSMSQTTNSSSSGGQPTSSTASGGTAGESSSDRIIGGDPPGPPSFMRDLQSQYESLGDRLAREVSASSSASSMAPSSISRSGNNRGGRGKSPGGSRRVRWAETARIASTMDADRAARASLGDVGDGGDGVASSPMDVLADMFRRKYTLPVFLVSTASIFLLVHLAGGPNDDSFARYDRGGGGGGGSSSSMVSSSQQGIPGGMTRSGGFEDVVFSLTPTTIHLGSLGPTMTVMHHTTPKISPTTLFSDPAVPSPSAVLGATSDGNEPGWIIVETASQSFGGGAVEPGVEVDDGSKQTLKWGYGIGVPTPDPALLLSAADDGSPSTLKWNSAPGVPTSDPALKYDEGSKPALVWNYPPGVPTPNPALLVEIAPPRAPDDGSPTTLKWGAETSDVRPSVVDPDLGTPTTLKWNYPPGAPTPDPALLTGVADQLTWGYPPGVPTPDPILLEGGADDGADLELVWGYPPGVPTPDPALLMSGGDEPGGWGYPPGEPTPDPALLNGVSDGGTDAPTKRNVETGLPPPSKRPVEKTVSSKPVTLKLQDMTPETARPGVPEETFPPAPKSPSAPMAPLVPVDHNGNPVEVAPGPSRPGGGGGSRPKVNTQPYNGPGGFNYQVHGNNPDWTDPDFNGPNGYTIDQIGFQGGGVIPQMQSSCGCCCCNCGGGSVGGYAARGMVLPVSPQGYAQHVQGVLDVNGQLRSIFPGSMTSGDALGCPWDCLIDETVPTKGRSNEDDALYEIFYTNPLNCCGTIIEVGAGDGGQYSTSFFFEKGMNWTTYLIEADPLDYEKIANNRNGKKVIAANGAFCKKGPYLYFDEESHAFQGITPEDDHSSELMSNDFEVTSSTSKVDCIRLDTVLAGIDHVNVMIVRVKGDPWAVMRTMDWNVRVDIWVILMEQKEGVTHDTARAALKLHDYVPAAWDIKLWCDMPANCMENEVWLRKNFNPIHKPLLQDHRGLRG